MSDALENRRFAYIGEGTNLVGFVGSPSIRNECAHFHLIQVNVNDLARLFATLFQQLVEVNGKKLASSPYQRYFIPHREFLEMKTLFAFLAAELYKHGKLDSPEVSSIKYEEANPMLA